MKLHGAGRGLRQTIVFPLAMIVLAIGYLGVLLAFGPLLEHLLYRGRMAQVSRVSSMARGGSLLSAIGAGFSTLLRAAQNSQHQLIAEPSEPPPASSRRCFC